MRDRQVTRERHDWSHWDTGVWHELKHGRDFSCSIRSLRSGAAKWAMLRGLRAHVRVVDRNVGSRVRLWFEEINRHPAGQLALFPRELGKLPPALGRTGGA